MITQYPTWSQTPVAYIHDGVAQQIDRPLGASDLQRLAARSDPNVTGRLLRDPSAATSMSPNEFCRATYFSDGCGQDSVAEILRFRPLWPVLLWIEIISGTPRTIRDLSGLYHSPTDPLTYRGLGDTEKEPYRFSPSLDTLEPGDSLLIPERVLLAPLNGAQADTTVELSVETFEDFATIYSIQGRSRHDHFNLVGPSIQFEKLRSGWRAHRVKPLDLGNALILDSHFMVGSCPVLLGCRSREVFFVSDLLDTGRDLVDVSSFDFAVIAELEDEITHLDSVSLHGPMSQRVIATDLTLKPGDYVLVRIPQGTGRLCLDGTYRPLGSIPEGGRPIAQKVKVIEEACRHIERLIRGNEELGIVAMDRLPLSDRTIGLLRRRPHSEDQGHA
jgi:hypothetical protein